ncbi:hypothetical protein SDC9_136751 [bioreactor metagenome]|uniref:Uncharacterized protein n=1 Tax=bioreactor metagenome TaxID=1076179 RepID=A0A645DK09_9ZZZZ
MRYFKLGSEKPERVPDNVANLYVRCGFTEVEQKERNESPDKPQKPPGEKGKSKG